MRCTTSPLLPNVIHGVEERNLGCKQNQQTRTSYLLDYRCKPLPPCSQSTFQELAKQGTLQAPKNRRARFKTCKARDPASPEGPQSPFQDLQSKGPCKPRGPQSPFQDLQSKGPCKPRRTAEPAPQALEDLQSLLPEDCKSEKLCKNLQSNVPRACKARDPASPERTAEPVPGLAKQGTLQAPKDRRARFQDLQSKLCKPQRTCRARSKTRKACFSLQSFEGPQSFRNLLCKLCKKMQNLLPQMTARARSKTCKGPFKAPKDFRARSKALQSKGPCKPRRTAEPASKACKATSGGTCRTFCPQTCFSLKAS